MDTINLTDCQKNIVKKSIITQIRGYVNGGTDAELYEWFQELKTQHPLETTIKIIERMVIEVGNNLE